MPEQSVFKSTTEPLRFSRVRWAIALMLTSTIAISYFDRQTLGVALKAIEQSFSVSDRQYSLLTSGFLITYAFMYAGGGKLMDVLGTRKGFAVIMVWWSLACAFHGLATNFSMLLASRLLLGMGEGGGFPAASKAVAEWFPARERATAMGLINAGTALGGVLAPPVVALIIELTSWPWVFFISGLIGLLWTGWWLHQYQTPDQHTRVTAEERQELQEVLKPQPSQTKNISWLQLLTFPQVWGLVCAKFLSDAAWFFYMFWLPKYFFDFHDFDTTRVGSYTWIPFAAAGIGCLAGGAYSSWLLRRGYSLDGSRKIALGASAAIMPLMLLVTHCPVNVAIVLFCIAFFGQQSWSTLVMILPVDLFPKHAVGSVSGLVGFGGAMGGVIFGLIVGQMLTQGAGYGPVFAIAGTLHLIAFAVILLTVRRIQPISV